MNRPGGDRFGEPNRQEPGSYQVWGEPAGASPGLESVRLRGEPTIGLGFRRGSQLGLFVPGPVPTPPPRDDVEVRYDLDDTLPEGDVPGQLFLDLGLG